MNNKNLNNCFEVSSTDDWNLILINEDEQFRKEDIEEFKLCGNNDLYRIKIQGIDVRILSVNNCRFFIK